MAGIYRVSKEKRRSRFYILLSIVFVFVMFKWGVPFFVDLIAGKGAVRQNQEKDVIPPQPPVLSALPEATNSSVLAVEGYTEANVALDLLINDSMVTTGKSAEDGSFTMSGTLTSGSNRVYVRATDEAGNTSVSEVKIVVFDDKPVTLTITSPKDGDEFFGKNSQIIDISGQVNKTDAQVVVNNSFVVVDSTGKFVHRYQLSSGTNTIKIVASDRAGNSAETTISILYTP